MNLETSAIQPNGREKVSYSNVKIQLVVGSHVSGSEITYAANRRRIDDLGVHFFKRGFSNFLLMEDASGNLDLNAQAVNDSAKRFRSYRSAYWHVLRGFNESDATKLTQLFEQNPIERFIRSGRVDGLDDIETHQQAYVYGVFAALDSITRKGLNVQLIGEKSSQIRKKYVRLDGEGISWWREAAKVAHAMDKEFAAQIDSFMSRYPERTRLLGIFGTAHAPIQENLPLGLQQICEIKQLSPGKSKSEAIALLHDLQRGELTDGEIEQRLNKATEGLKSRKLIQF